MWAPLGDSSLGVHGGPRGGSPRAASVPIILFLVNPCWHGDGCGWVSWGAAVCGFVNLHCCPLAVPSPSFPVLVKGRSIPLIPVQTVQCGALADLRWKLEWAEGVCNGSRPCPGLVGISASSWW